ILRYTKPKGVTLIFQTNTEKRNRDELDFACNCVDVTGFDSMAFLLGSPTKETSEQVERKDHVFSVLSPSGSYI
ncbi:hypothetical protein J6590_009626, partial [Homalodisca vitripennis]